MSRLAKILLALLGLAVAIQLVPVERSNPPEDGPLQAPPDVAAVLDAACIDCHTNHTRWPWYASVAPVSWLVAMDVRRGRAKLNFSEWDRLPAVGQRGELMQLRRRVKEGEMPLPRYLRLHSDAALSAAQRQLLQDWALSSAEAIPL